MYTYTSHKMLFIPISNEFECRLRFHAFEDKHFCLIINFKKIDVTYEVIYVNMTFCL